MRAWIRSFHYFMRRWKKSVAKNCCSFRKKYCEEVWKNKEFMYFHALIYHVIMRSLVFKEHFVTLYQKIIRTPKLALNPFIYITKVAIFWINDNQWTFLRRMLCISINNRKNTFTSSQCYNTRSIKSWVQWKWWKIYNHAFVVTLTFESWMNSLH